jgi:hypothetical protein
MYEIKYLYGPNDLQQFINTANSQHYVIISLAAEKNGGYAIIYKVGDR